MTKESWTYPLKKVALFVCVWEIVFWCAFFLLLHTQYFISETILFVESQRLMYLLIVILVIVGVLRSVYRYQQTMRFMGTKVQTTIASPMSIKKTCWRYFWFRNALVLLIIAWAQPAYGAKKVKGTSRNMEIVVSLDISNSMNACDINPNVSRLEIAKRSINAMIDQLEGEKIGLSVFAGEAYTYLPLTTDYEGAKLFVDEVQTYMSTLQGTDIKRALNDAFDMFSSDKKMPKTVLLITDGGNHEENPTRIFKKYQKHNIQLLVLGIGTSRGGPIPVDPFDPSKGYKRNAMGEIVQSKLNEKFIRYLATAGNGEIMLSDQTYPDLKTLLKNIKRAEYTTQYDVDFEIKEQRYQIPLALSIFCWIGWQLGATKRIKNKANINYKHEKTLT